jgi:RND family efflux transporter MFP subunit
MTRTILALACLALVGSAPLLAQDARGGLAGTAFDCIARPKAVTELASQGQGVLTEILVGRGDMVARGEVVARLDSELQQNAVGLARIRAENEAAITAGEARLKFRQTEFDRVTTLMDRGSSSQSNLDEAAVELQLARGELAMAKAERRIAEAELAQARQRLARRDVVAPFDAVVVEVTASLGEYAHEEAPVMTLAQLDPLRVEVYLPIRYTRQVSRGKEAVVTFPAPIDARRTAEVTAIDRVFDAASGTFGIRLELPNPDFALPGGIRCTLKFEEDGGG